MKAVILAAGQGTRIRSVHGDHPKCLITFNDSQWTILDQQIHSLLIQGIRDIGIVVGYERQQIIRHIARHYPEPVGRFVFIENPDYAKTNNIYSLWLARNWVRGDSFVCLNADVAFDRRVLSPALASTAPITMIVDRNWRDETMKALISGIRIKCMSKAISRRDFSATYIGITAFDRAIVHRFLSRVNKLVRDGHTQVFFNAAVQQLIDEGTHVGYTETAGLPWAEIDDPGDLDFARLHVALACEVMICGTPVAVYNLHLESRGSDALRVSQLSETVADAMTNARKRPLIMAGDLNLNVARSSWSPELQRLGFRSVIASPVPHTTTARGVLRQGRTIDWVFVADRIEAKSAHVWSNVEASDHYPVSCELRFTT